MKLIIFILSCMPLFILCPNHGRDINANLRTVQSNHGMQLSDEIDLSLLLNTTHEKEISQITFSIYDYLDTLIQDPLTRREKEIYFNRIDFLYNKLRPIVNINEHISLLELIEKEHKRFLKVLKIRLVDIVQRNQQLEALHRINQPLVFSGTRRTRENAEEIDLIMQEDIRNSSVGSAMTEDTIPIDYSQAFSANNSLFSYMSLSQDSAPLSQSTTRTLWSNSSSSQSNSQSPAYSEYG